MVSSVRAHCTVPTTASQQQRKADGEMEHTLTHCWWVLKPATTGPHLTQQCHPRQVLKGTKKHPHGHLVSCDSIVHHRQEVKGTHTS